MVKPNLKLIARAVKKHLLKILHDYYHANNPERDCTCAKRDSDKPQ
jgi:hypothetical protein